MASIDGNSVAAIVAAGGSAFAAVITALNRRTATVTEAKTDAQTEVIEAHGEDLEHIKTNVDGALSAAGVRAEVAESRNVELTNAMTAADPPLLVPPLPPVPTAALPHVEEDETPAP
jgi:hypothetical protein